jgi:hypothetical protein
MANKKKLPAGQKSKGLPALPPPEPWISMRNGSVIIIFTSIGMAVLTAIQVAPIQGWLEGILWGLLFGAMIWAIFLGFMFVNRFLKRSSSQPDDKIKN